MDRIRRTVRELLDGLAVPLRHAVVGAVAFGALGAVAGLVLGLRTYGPTAWAAVLEVGVPAGALGFVLGLVAGLLAHRSSARGGGPAAARRVRR